MRLRAAFHHVRIFGGSIFFPLRLYPRFAAGPITLTATLLRGYHRARASWPGQIAVSHRGGAGDQRGNRPVARFSTPLNVLPATTLLSA